jgi:hypothetical protein
MKVDGGCHCGNIRYEAEVDPEGVVICHCTDCQTLSGSAFRTVVPTIEGTFRLLSGVPKLYVKAGESGNKREQTFCPECGTPIYSAPEGAGSKVVGLRVGTRTRGLRGPAGILGTGRAGAGAPWRTECLARRVRVGIRGKRMARFRCAEEYARGNSRNAQ